MFLKCSAPIALTSLLLASCAPTMADPRPVEALTQRAPLPEPTDPPPAELAALAQAIDREAIAALEAEHLPGLAVVVVRSGRTILKRGYGVANVAAGRAMDPDRTLVRIASISKALTGLAVTRLTADGRLDMNADVTRFVGNVRNLSGSDRPVTVRDLLSHSSGFDQIGTGRQVREFERPIAERQALRPTLRQFLEAGNLRRVTPPGMLFRYDTYGTTLAGLVLEEVTGLSYPEAMRRELFKPIGMNDSFVDAEGEAFDRLATGYGFVDGKYVAQPYVVHVTTPASSIDATPADMGRLLEALTADGANSHGRLFSADTLRRVLAPDFRPQPHCPGATHGFQEGQIGSTAAQAIPRTLGHSGGLPGYSSLLTIVPNAQLGVFVTANRDFEAGGGEIPVIGHITDLVVKQLGGNATGAGLDLQLSQSPGDYRGVAGDYYWGVYCRTCSAEERSQRAWTRGDPIKVSALQNGVKIGDQTYLATTTAGVFLRENGKRHACFGKDLRGRTTHFNFSDSAQTFERGE